MAFSAKYEMPAHASTTALLEALLLSACLCHAVRSELVAEPGTLAVWPTPLPEAHLRNRAGTTVNFTLTGDTWIAALGEEPALTSAWLNTLRADGSARNGWDAVVTPALSSSSLRRSSPSVLTLRLGWLPEFDVSRSEVVRVSAPWWATASNVSARPTWCNLTVTPTTPRARLGGDLLAGHISETALRSRSHTLQAAQ